MMVPHRRNRGGLNMRRVLAVAAVVALAAPAHAQEAWPQRPVTIVVPFAAGGSADLLARILQQHLQARFGVPFVVDNKSGAGGSIGTGFVAKAPADGYTLLVGTVSSIAINAFLYTKLNFDVARDLQPVSLLVRFPNLLFVNPKVPAKSVPELIDYLKANNGKTNYGSSGIGTSSHLSSVMFELAPKTKLTPVPFRSTAEVVNSMLGGNIELAIDSMTTVWPFAAAGNVRALAVTTPRRRGAGFAEHRRDAQGLRGHRLAGAICARRYVASDRRQDRRRGEAGVGTGGGHHGAQERRRRARAFHPG